VAREVPVTVPDPVVPQLLHDVVYELVERAPGGSASRRSGLWEVAIHNVLSGGATESLVECGFSSAEMSKMCRLRIKLVDREVHLDAGAHIEAAKELCDIIYDAANGFANDILQVRKNNSNAASLLKRRTDMVQRHRGAAQRWVELAASELSREVLLGRVSIAAVLDVGNEVSSWPTFYRALVGECYWIAADAVPTQLDSAWVAVKSLRDPGVQEAAAHAAANIRILYEKCRRALGGV